MSYTLAPQIAVVPPADNDGCWHYTYITHHPDTGEWYGGKHSTSNLDDGYLGSGNWVAAHVAGHELVIEVIEFFNTEAEAFAAEAALITWDVIDSDPLCRNETEGGRGITLVARARMADDPEWQRKYREGTARREADPEYQRKYREAIADPEYQRKYREGIARRDANPEYQRKIRERNANPEWRRKIHEANARKIDDPEWQRKHREGMARLHANPEYQRKNREANIQTAADPEWQRKIRKGIARRTADPEWQRKNREAHARMAADPEWQRKHAERQARRWAIYYARKAMSCAEKSGDTQ